MNLTYAWIFLLVALTYSCEPEETYAPKPRGYFKIQFPEKHYRKIKPDQCPFEFEIPTYGFYKQHSEKPCWPNIEFPKLNAVLHVSYVPVKKDSLAKLINDAHILVNHHQVKSTGIEDIQILRDSARVYGTLFEIKGNTASVLQFYVTDSTTHFIRGALYFNCRPNADSLKRSTAFLKQDLIHFIKTLQWN